MDSKKQKTPVVSPAKVAVAVGPKSASIAEDGIGTAKDFARLMGALISDIISGRVSPGIGNAAVNAGGKLLKVVEMQHRYGSPSNGRDRTLNLLGS